LRYPIKATITSIAVPRRRRILSAPRRAVAPCIPGEQTPSCPCGLKNPVHI